MKTDIKDRDDIEKIIKAFYKKVIADDVISIYFTDVIQVNWEVHTPLMINFWENILFFTDNYNGNPMNVHKRLDAVHKMSLKDFHRWNSLFTDTVNELFKGEKANLMKETALNVSAVMQSSLFKYN